MKYQLKKLSAALLTLCTITACSSDNTTATNTPTDTVMAAYNGNWTTGCVISQLPAITDTYMIYEFTTDATTWQFVTSGYLDEGCTTQIQGTEETGISERGTTTVSGTYTDEGQITTADGLLASNLRLTVGVFTNTLDEPSDEPNTAIGTTNDSLVYVNDANVLFLDDILLGINEEPGTLVLTLPFDPVL